MNTSMYRWELPDPSVSTLQKVTAPIPEPRKNELLIRVSAVSLNYRDLLVANGKLLNEGPSLPFVPASDMAGVVVATGADVSRFKTGDRVISHFWSQWRDGHPPPEVFRDGLSLGGPLTGVLAEYVVLDEESVVNAPRSLTDEQASTLPVAGLTAWFALMEAATVSPNDTVVVQGTGGVALFGLQIAAAFGARVIVTSRSGTKLAQAKALGAWGLINTSSNSDWAAQALAITEGQGADHILELLGGSNLERSVSALASGGTITQIGFMESIQTALPVSALMLKNVRLQGVVVGHRHALENLIRAFDEHHIKPVIDAVYEFHHAPAAFEHLARGAFGKIVISVNPDQTSSL